MYVCASACAEEVRHPCAFLVIKIALNVQIYMGAWALNVKRMTDRHTDVVYLLWCLCAYLCGSWYKQYVPCYMTAECIQYLFVSLLLSRRIIKKYLL